MGNEKNRNIETVRNRFIVVPIVIFLASIAVLYEIFDIQMNEEIPTQYTQKIVQPRRGDILDRKGRVLACSVPEYTVSFDARIAHFKKNPNLISENIDSIADGLARIFVDDNRDRQYYYNLIKTAEKEHKLVRLHNNRLITISCRKSKSCR